MSLDTCYPLIGVDHNNNEHDIEFPGKSPVDAATKAGERRNYTKVLSRVAHMKRSVNGIWYRKELWVKPPPRFAEQSFEQQIRTFNGQMVKRPEPLIKYLRERGMEITSCHAKGKLKISATPLVTCTLSAAECDAVRDLVRENVSTFIEALEGDKAPAPASPDATESDPESPPDELKGRKTIREVLLAMLPQMPTVFTIADLLERLKSSGYIALSEQPKKVSNNFYVGPLAQGLAIKVPGKRGKFQVADSLRHRRTISEEAKQDENVEVISAEPQTVPTPTAELDAEQLVPPRAVIEVPPPGAVPAVETAVLPTPLLQEKTAPQQSTASHLPAAITTILDLAAQAAAGASDSDSLCRSLNEACEQFETTMLDAVSALTSSVKAATDQMSKQARVRKTLVQSLTGLG